MLAGGAFFVFTAQFPLLTSGIVSGDPHRIQVSIQQQPPLQSYQTCIFGAGGVDID
jgi:hypothetical protein